MTLREIAIILIVYVAVILGMVRQALYRIAKENLWMRAVWFVLTLILLYAALKVVEC